MRIKSKKTALWFRNAISAAFKDTITIEQEQKKQFTKRRIELKNMQERLLNSYLVGVVDEETFRVKPVSLKDELKVIETQGESNHQIGP